MTLFRLLVAIKALLAALPRCDVEGCEQAATRHNNDPGNPEQACQEHGDEDYWENDPTGSEGKSWGGWVDEEYAPQLLALQEMLS